MYKELKEEYSTKLNEVTKKNQVFWAFSDKQLKEGMEEYSISKDNKMVSIGMGGYLPVKNLQSFLTDTKELEQWYKGKMLEVKKNKAEREKAIIYELANHECFYSGDITPACEVLPEISEAEVLRVYKHSMRS